MQGDGQIGSGSVANAERLETEARLDWRKHKGSRNEECFDERPSCSQTWDAFERMRALPCHDARTSIKLRAFRERGTTVRARNFALLPSEGQQVVDRSSRGCVVRSVAVQKIEFLIGLG